MKVELTRFKVKQGKSQRVDEWMEMLNEHIDQVLLTLKDEKMFVETIFREKRKDGEFLYWYSIQGEGGIHVEQSSHEIDKKHLEFWYECIDEEVPHVDMETKVVMIPEYIKSTMK
ncbi:DUF6176 family protein [Bacillus nitratireducens]|uniref:DUF6176 family protein n=1 Tax=Bacillus nitratireducens TaxID=2026193 RepID=UPI00089978CA|nr:DUF6176 family protein [Bacillus nitratireducens]SEB21298.1 hypothetical protein SAMN04488146_12312 [Bacillus nitratireducens]